MKHHARLGATALILALASPGLSAQETAEVAPLVITAERLAAADEADTREEVRPGDGVRYTLVFTNPTPESLRNVVFADPIPEGFVYRLGTARSDDETTVVEFSIDDGETFSAAPTVEVVQPDGSVVTEPAPAELYTHIRWTVAGPLAGGASVTATFDATLGGSIPPTGGR